MTDAFARMLRQVRQDRHLTQEQLAERAGISPRSLVELERGRSPRPDTVTRLSAALGLSDGKHAEFTAAARERYWSRRTDQGPSTGPGFNQLPHDLPDFTGRRAELAMLNKELGSAHEPSGLRLVNVAGPPGMGKTALTVHAAHRFSATYPDGLMFAALRGGGEPAEPAAVLADLLRALDVDGSVLPADMEARATMFRSRIAGRRILLLLDDAAGHRQVEALLPATGAVLISSRTPLTGLPGVTVVDLDPLPTVDAVDLLGRVVGQDRVDAEPDAAAALVSACGHLPLAVRIAAARLASRPQWTVSALMARFADERQRLDELRYGDLTVRSGLELAHRALSPPAAQAFALLGGFGLASVPEWSLGLVLGTGQAQAGAVLDELVDARLLDDLGPDEAGQVRYGFHDLTRLYAREKAAPLDPGDRTAALSRCALGWLSLLRRAQERLECERYYLDDPGAVAVPAHILSVVDGVPAESRALAWLNAERTTIPTLVGACVDAGLVAYARAVAGCAVDFFGLCGDHDSWRGIVQTVLDACRADGDRAGEVRMLRSLGECYLECDDSKLALATLQEARELAIDIGDRTSMAMIGKATAFVLMLIGRLDEAEREARSALTELATLGHHSARVLTLGALGWIQRQRGDHADAVQTYTTAVSEAEFRGDRFGLATALRGLSGAQLATGSPAEAERAARRAADLFGDLGDQVGRGQSVRAIGEAIATDPRRIPEAQHALRDAAAAFDVCGFAWGAALVELNIGELTVRHGGPADTARLRRSLRYWLAEGITTLQARTLVALADAAEIDGDPAMPGVLRAAHLLYAEIDAPEAAVLAKRLGVRLIGPIPDVADLAAEPTPSAS